MRIWKKKYNFRLLYVKILPTTLSFNYAWQFLAGPNRPCPISLCLSQGLLGLSLIGSGWAME